MIKPSLLKPFDDMARNPTLNAHHLFVYVQATPCDLSPRAKRFRDIEQSASFKMSHSSKVTLGRAMQAKNCKIIAIGHSSVLPEALARGAEDAISVTLGDDPLAQAEDMRRCVSGFPKETAIFLVGENLEGPFSGAALCGTLSYVFTLDYMIDDGLALDSISEPTVILVKDDGILAPPVDVRKIGKAFAKEIPSSSITGVTRLETINSRKNPDIISGLSSKEIAQNISRRLRRLST